jgi:hypothetical protein
VAVTTCSTVAPVMVTIEARAGDNEIVVGAGGENATHRPHLR